MISVPLIDELRETRRRLADECAGDLDVMPKCYGRFLNASPDNTFAPRCLQKFIASSPNGHSINQSDRVCRRQVGESRRGRVGFPN